jgi:hypothetical protein
VHGLQTYGLQTQKVIERYIPYRSDFFDALTRDASAQAGMALDFRP